MNLCEITVHVQEKKKKKRENVGRTKTCKPNGHRVGLDCTFVFAFDVCVLFFFFLRVYDYAVTVYILFNEQQS